MEAAIQYTQSLQHGLSPVITQSIQLLSLPVLSLQSFLNNAILDNPFLYSDLQEYETFDPNIIHILDSPDEFYNSRMDRDKNYSPLERILTNIHDSETLLGELNLQLYALHLPKDMEELGLAIIRYIDENGYLSEELSYLSSCLHVAVPRLEEVLLLIQSFSPAGVGARNLPECLINQIPPDKARKKIIVKIIESDLDTLGRHQFQRLSQKYHISMKEVQDIFDYIRTLEPYPGRIYAGSHTASYIVPDIIVKKEEHNLSVELVGKSSQIIRMEEEYCRLLRDKSVNAKDRTYLASKYREARQLIQSIELREKTITRFICFLVEYQKNFFLYGPEFVRSLSMQQAAEFLHISLSTISRCADGKYASTPWGIFPLKFFFSKSLSEHDSTKSREAAKATIASLIASENPSEPLSDQNIYEKLQEYGICISRRTVAKYRDELGILNHKRRKRYT